MGSDALCQYIRATKQRFNSRSRMGSDFSRAKNTHVDGRFQFALPHGERRIDREIRQRRNHVSIRAPAWGATIGGNHYDKYRIVSIRAPAWGATPAVFVQRMVQHCFNSRSRMGSDCHHAMAGTACIESALFASQAGKVQWCKMQFVCHVFKSISIQHAISVANTPAFR